MIAIRKYKKGDESDLSTIICRCLYEVNSIHYSEKVITEIVNRFTPENIKSLSKEREIFVAELDGKAVGTASLDKDNRPDQSGYVCLTVFVLPDFHGKGIGKKLVSEIEDIVKNKGKNSLQIPSSHSAFEFYQKLGYELLPGTQRDPNDVSWVIKSL